MDQKALEFVQNQLLRWESRLKPYVEAGDGRPYPKRHAFFRLAAMLERFLDKSAEERWLVMPGISGVGKTTILAQLHRDFQTRFAAKHILSVSLDDAALVGISLTDILDAYEGILGSSFEQLTQPVLLLIDEAHRDAQWSAALKVLWGRTNKVFIVCTGSSAVLLASQVEDIGRRISVEKLHPLSFTEYSLIRHGRTPDQDLSRQLNAALFDQPDAGAAFAALTKLTGAVSGAWATHDRVDLREYMSIGTVPFALQAMDEASAFLAIGRIIDKLIQKDILELGDFKADTVRKIKPLLLHIAEGSTVSVSRIGGLFGLTKATIQDMLDLLVKAEILIRVAPFKAENKPSKYLFMCPALRNALLDISGSQGTVATRRGDALEDAVGLHLYREFVAPGRGLVSYDPEQGGADFVLDLRAGRRLVIEVGAGAKGLGQAEQTMSKAKGDYGLVFNTDPLQLSADGRIVKVPHDVLFLL